MSGHGERSGESDMNDETARIGGQTPAQAPRLVAPGA